MAFPIVFLVLLCTAWAQDIHFKEDNTSTCTLPGGRRGRCKDQAACPEAFRDFPRIRPNVCGFNGKKPIVCCPVKIKTDSVTESPRNPVALNDISQPVVDFKCGDSKPEGVYNFDFSEPIGCPMCGIGGLPARFVLVKYSVLVGSRDESGSIDWVCTGALINRIYVLTAAHCLTRRLINVVRLGEHDYNDPDDGADPITISVDEEFLYPEFRQPQGYHDLALLKLNSEYPKFHRYINPVCLPWGEASKRTLVNDVISLTGWGATEFGGTGSPVLQEVNVTVFSTSFCDRSYSTLPDYNLVWPRGIGENILCAGDPQGGKDACQGDSGGPVTYLDEDFRYVLAGVVSRGYGCGLAEFPGLYIDIRHPPYLAWIKKVAFQ